MVDLTYNSSEQSEIYALVQGVEGRMATVFKESGCLDLVQIIVGRMDPKYAIFFREHFASPTYVPALGVCALETMSPYLDEATLHTAAAFTEVMFQIMQLNELNRLPPSFRSDDLSVEQKLAEFIEPDAMLLLKYMIQYQIKDPYERRTLLANVRNAFSSVYHPGRIVTKTGVYAENALYQDAVPFSHLPFLLEFRRLSNGILPAVPRFIVSDMSIMQKYMDDLKLLPFINNRKVEQDDLFALSNRSPSLPLLQIYEYLKSAGVADLAEELLGRILYGQNFSTKFRGTVTNDSLREWRTENVENTKSLLSFLNNKELIARVLNAKLLERNNGSMGQLYKYGFTNNSLISQWFMKQGIEVNQTLIKDIVLHT